MWNPSTRSYECGKTCEVGEHLDIKNCACKKFVVNNLVKIFEDEYNSENNKCSSCW